MFQPVQKAEERKTVCDLKKKNLEIVVFIV